MTKTTTKQARHKVALTVTLDPELLQAMDDWIEAQPLRPSKTVVIAAALKQFLKLPRGAGATAPTASRRR